jgi:hypothetical protein
MIVPEAGFIGFLAAADDFSSGDVDQATRAPEALLPVAIYTLLPPKYLAKV